MLFLRRSRQWACRPAWSAPGAPQPFWPGLHQLRLHCSTWQLLRAVLWRGCCFGVLTCMSAQHAGSKCLVMHLSCALLVLPYCIVCKGMSSCPEGAVVAAACAHCVLRRRCSRYVLGTVLSVMWEMLACQYPSLPGRSSLFGATMCDTGRSASRGSACVRCVVRAALARVWIVVSACRVLRPCAGGVEQFSAVHIKIHCMTDAANSLC